MNFPVFLNKWIIGFKPIKYTILWYWYRLINHSNWRMDDHQRYADFWSFYQKKTLMHWLID